MQLISHQVDMGERASRSLRHPSLYARLVAHESSPATPIRVRLTPIEPALRRHRRRFCPFPRMTAGVPGFCLRRRRCMFSIKRGLVSRPLFQPQRQPAAAHAERGLTLTETLAVLATMAFILTLSIPSLGHMHRAAQMRSAAQQVAGLLVRCRARAILNQRTTGVVFERTGGWRCYVAVDGDGDGIRRADLTSGIDQAVGTVVPLRTGAPGLGILAGEPVPNPSGRGRLGGNLDDPVRAGRGDIISFTPGGTATPSSVYFTDHDRRMLALRVVGATGRVRTMTWRSGMEKWKQGWY